MNGHDSVEDYPRLVRSLELDDDSTVLDVPCGQGNVTEALARAVPRGRVIGLDLSNTMLKLARRRLERAGLLDRTTLLRANAQQLPLEDASVDAISACAGLHLFPDPDGAIAEMRRVLRPGGRVAGLVFVQQTQPLRKLVQAAVKRVSGMISFDFDELGRRFEARGFTDWQWHRAGIVGYFQARAQ
jgi:ubiquinone/menaquinone biosynthesis C-methylase UbiE